MADIEAPSFSLGLDFDLDSNSGHQEPNTLTRDGFSTPIVEDSDPDDDHQAPPTLSRLRRGPGPSNHPKQPIAGRDCMRLPSPVEDDIEEFSPHEFGYVPSGAHQHSFCSSSKSSLRECGVLTRQVEMETSGGKRKHTSSATASLDSSREKVKLSKSAGSPLRRFKLIDSDSDDASEILEINRNRNSMDFSEKMERSMSACGPSAHALQTVDPWEHYLETPSVPTPALDSFCEEYFRTACDKNAALNSVPGLCSSKLKSTNWENKEGEEMDHGYVLPPALHYFFHEEPRIRKLVRSRLQHFFPLTSVSNTDFLQKDESIIDYRGQFSHGNGPKKQDGIKVAPKSSRKNHKAKKSNGEISSAFGNWVDPKHQSIPKDAGRRRVHADGQRSGHWYTGENGMKVYVSKNGQELTGQVAYRQYKRDSGARFRRSKRKTATKKKGG
ncbi:hypothetical protein Dimus_000729 [Dionaea muscipula]